MSDKKEDTLPPGHKLVADDGSGVEIEYKGPKNKDGKYLVSVQNPRSGKSVLKRMSSADMHHPSALDQAKKHLKNSGNVSFQVGRFTVTHGPAAKKSQGGKRRKTKRRKRRRKRKTRRRSRKRKRRTRRRRR